MTWTKRMSAREVDRLMRSLPNIVPRGHGTMILYEHGHSRKDCQHRLCHSQAVQKEENRKSGGSFQDCVTVGPLTRREMVYETMSAISYPPFIRRLNEYLKGSEENLMDYVNEKHRNIFSETVQRLNQQNYALMAGIYLLTADHQLWVSSKPHIVRNGIHIKDIKILNCSVRAYILYCAAKDLYLGTKHITVSDLADTNLISAKEFALICNAMTIRRFGLNAINFYESEEGT